MKKLPGLWIDYDINKASPEHVLWLAVIDRAQVDFIKGFQGEHAVDKKYLHRFFYETKVRPCNLRWICDMLFEDNRIPELIISRTIEVKKIYEESGCDIDDFLAIRYTKKPKSN